MDAAVSFDYIAYGSLDTHDSIKSAFSDAVNLVASNISLYAVDPDRNLVRNRKIDAANSFLSWFPVVLPAPNWNFSYDLSFRIVRFPIADGSYECIVTNLPSEEFPPQRIKLLYYARWGIEGSFRKLKYTIGLSNFHAYKPDYIKQEYGQNSIIPKLAGVIGTVKKTFVALNVTKFDGTALSLSDSYEMELTDVEADFGGETEAGTTQRDVVWLGVVNIAVSFSVTAKWLNCWHGISRRRRFPWIILIRRQRR